MIRQLNFVKELKMKKKIILCVFALIVLPFSLMARSGITATFSTGSPISGTSIGLKLGPLNPYAGVDVARISGKYTSDDTQWADGANGGIVMSYESTSTFEGTATLIMPRVGLKFYLWKAYLVGEFSLWMPSVSGTDKGTTVYYDYNGVAYDWDMWDESLTKQDEDYINDALDFVGFKFGFGSEYYLSEHVSIGGEFGFRILSNSFTMGDDSEDNELPYYYYREKWKDEISASIGVTYTMFSLNFIL